MATLAQFSQTNLVNSLAQYLAAKLLSVGYLVHWAERDTVETLDGWYPGYTAGAAAYLADSAFQARAQAAQGLMAVLPAFPTEPRFLARPTGDGTALGPDTVAIPALALDMGSPGPGPFVGLGQTERFRVRRLTVEAYLRNAREQGRLEDWLEQWITDDLPIPVYDHDAGTLALVDSVVPRQTRILRGVTIEQGEAQAFQVLLHTLLDYSA